MSASERAGITRQNGEKITEKNPSPRPPQSQLSRAHHENTQQSPCERVARVAVGLYLL